MTIVGHSLVATTLAILFTPASRTVRQKALFICVFVFAAHIPDLPLPGWGHWQYHISHSIMVNMVLMASTVMLLCYLKYIKLWGSYRIVIGVLITWLSHFLLDSLYNHGNGIGIFWPFTDNKLSLPLPWFATLQNSPSVLSQHNLKVFFMEFLFYFPVFLTVFFICRLFLKMNSD